MKLLSFAAALSLLCILPAHADKVHVPKPGTPERKAIMDGLRRWLKDEKYFPGLDVVFQVDFLKVHNGWAWVSATPLTKKDGKVLAEGRRWLLQFKDGKWKSVDFPDLMIEDDPDAEFLKKLRKKYPDVPADIFE